MMTDKQPTDELKADESNSDMNMPEEIWVYDRDGRLEARTDDIVVGNVKYIRADIHEALKEEVTRQCDANAYKAMRLREAKERATEKNKQIKALKAENERLREAIRFALTPAPRRIIPDGEAYTRLQQALQGKEGAE